PEAARAGPIASTSNNHSGAAKDVERDVAPLLAGPKAASVSATDQAYVEVQRSSDLSLAWGSRTFILGGNVADLTAAHLDALVAPCERVPGESSISITAMRGAIGRVADDAMAFSGRSSPFDIAPDTSWADPALDDANADWTRRAWTTVETV